MHLVQCLRWLALFLWTLKQCDGHVTYYRITAHDLAAPLAEIDIADGEFPAARATCHLGVEGPRYYLVAKAYSDYGYARRLARCADKVHQSENPLMVGEGVVLFEYRMLVLVRKINALHGKENGGYFLNG